MSVSDMVIERAHRLPSRTSTRPIIVKFSRFKDKDRALKTYRERRVELQDAGTADTGGDNAMFTKHLET